MDVYIAILTGGEVRSELAAVVAAMLRDPRYETYIEYAWGRPIPSNRCQIAKAMLATDAKHLLMIDSDVEPLRNLLDVVELDLDVVTFPCPIWRPGRPEPPVVMNITPLDGSYNVDIGGIEPFEIMRGGFSAVMIARRVLEAMPGPFAYKFNDEGINVADEDIMFCDKARERGFKIWTSPRHLCEHYKHVGLLKIVNEFARVDA